MNIRFKNKFGRAEEMGDVVHVVPLSKKDDAGILFKSGERLMIKWTDILKIYA